MNKKLLCLLSIAAAEGQAGAALAKATAEAKANQLLSSSLTPALISRRQLDVAAKQVEKWNGVRPSVEASSSGLMISLPAMNK